MIHEPECPMNLPIGDLPQNADCPFCPVIRIAYRRGREDAAKAVENLYYWVMPPVADDNHLVMQADASSAARGDGEQE